VKIKSELEQQNGYGYPFVVGAIVGIWPSALAYLAYAEILGIFFFVFLPQAPPRVPALQIALLNNQP